LQAIMDFQWGVLSDIFGAAGTVVGAGIDAAGFVASGVAETAREAAFVASGGEAGAADLQTSDFLARTNSASELGKGKLVIEFRNGIPVPVESQEADGFSVDVDTGSLLAGGV